MAAIPLAGGRAVLRAKLKLGPSGDVYEQEADRVAEQVMRTPVTVQRRCDGCREELQRSGEASAELSPGLERRVNALHGGGEPLPAGEREFFESRFGQEFGDVRLHTGGEAAALSESLSARAFTVGQDVVMGAGEYRPGSDTGRRLLAHELTHVVQQGEAVRREEVQEAPPADEEQLLGERLWRDFPAGVSAAFYDPLDTEISSQAATWADREQAVGGTKNPLSAANLQFGKGFAEDKFQLVPTLTSLGGVLATAAAKAGQPEGVIPLPGTGPAKVRKLALFGHGTTSWLGLQGQGGRSVQTGNVAGVVKGIAPHLSDDVTIALFSCNGARSPGEAENWYKGTMDQGGATSLAGTMRDALVDEGIDQATVWGHTTTGHTTGNFALRFFTAAAGKGAEGESFFSEYPMDFITRLIASMELEDEIGAKGYVIEESQRKRYEAKVELELRRLMYKCYGQANAELTYEGEKLAEQAPFYPLQVSELIWDYWLEYWKKERPGVADKLIKSLGLKKG